MTQIICPWCRASVEVVDKIVAEHGGGCRMSGVTWAPRLFSLGPGSPKVEVLGFKITPQEDGGVEVEIIAGVSVPNPANN